MKPVPGGVVCAGFAVLAYVASSIPLSKAAFPAARADLSAAGFLPVPGCGTGSMFVESSVGQYRRAGALSTRVIALTGKERALIHRVLLSQGFSRNLDVPTLSYSRMHKGLFPMRSSVFLNRSGQLFSSVTRSKLRPF